MAVGVGGGPDCAQYLPAVLVTNSKPGKLILPKQSFDLSVQTDVGYSRAAGALSCWC